MPGLYICRTLLKMIKELKQATNLLEVGMFTRYGSVCFAEALPVATTVLTCDLDEESATRASEDPEHDR